MKKTIAILLVALMALTLFAACGSKTDNDNSDKNDAGEPAKSDPTPVPDPNAELYGTWTLAGGEGEDAEQAVAMMMAFGMTMTFTFNEDGTGSEDASFRDETQSVPFTYTAENGKLTMVPQVEDQETSESDYRIEDGKLYLTVDDQALIFTKK
ncbi:MAG: lipocalin family protein [Clostridia bacterium]|nr:lipocalin family protein [Clostridia bacterium]